MSKAAKQLRAMGSNTWGDNAALLNAVADVMDEIRPSGGIAQCLNAAEKADRIAARLEQEGER